MSDLSNLQAKAAALRKELTEIENAIQVIERYSSSVGLGFSALVAGQDSAENWRGPTLVKRINEWLMARGEALNCRTALVGILKNFPDGLTKDQLRDGLKALKVDVGEATLTWTLSEHKGIYFESKERGVWALIPGAELL